MLSSVLNSPSTGNACPTFYLLLNESAVPDAPFSVPFPLILQVDVVFPPVPYSAKHTSQRALRTLRLSF